MSMYIYTNIVAVILIMKYGPHQNYGVYRYIHSYGPYFYILNIFLYIFDTNYSKPFGNISITITYGLTKT